MVNYYSILKSALCNDKSKQWAKTIANNIGKSYQIKYVKPDGNTRQVKAHFCIINGSVIVERDSRKEILSNIVSINRTNIEYEEISILIPYYLAGADDLIKSASNKLTGNQERYILTWQELQDLGIIINGHLSQKDLLILLMLINNYYNIKYNLFILWMLLHNTFCTEWTYNLFLRWLKIRKHVKVDMNIPKSILFFAMTNRKQII